LQHSFGIGEITGYGVGCGRRDCNHISIIQWSIKVVGRSAVVRTCNVGSVYTVVSKYEFVRAVVTKAFFLWRYNFVTAQVFASSLDTVDCRDEFAYFRRGAGWEFCWVERRNPGLQLALVIHDIACSMTAGKDCHEERRGASDHCNLHDGKVKFQSKLFCRRNKFRKEDMVSDATKTRVSHNHDLDSVATVPHKMNICFSQSDVVITFGLRELTGWSKRERKVPFTS
jgi:hypothetical protein